MDDDMPFLGQTVAYVSRTGEYELPALVTMTRESQFTPGIEKGAVPALSSERHVHLHVFTPGRQGSYQEFNVPFGEEDTPRSWHW